MRNFCIDTWQRVSVRSTSYEPVERSILRYTETNGDEWPRPIGRRPDFYPRRVNGSLSSVHEYRNFLLTDERARIKEITGNARYTKR